MCFCFWIIAVLSEGMQTSFVFARYFYYLCNSVILVFHGCALPGKLSWTVFKKVRRNEFNVWLGSLSK